MRMSQVATLPGCWLRVWYPPDTNTTNLPCFDDATVSKVVQSILDTARFDRQPLNDVRGPGDRRWSIADSLEYLLVINHRRPAPSHCTVLPAALTKGWLLRPYELVRPAELRASGHTVGSMHQRGRYASNYAENKADVCHQQTPVLMPITTDNEENGLRRYKRSMPARRYGIAT